MAAYSHVCKASEFADVARDRLLSFTVGYIGAISYLGITHEKVIHPKKMLALLVSRYQTTLATVLANKERLLMWQILFLWQLV